MTAAPRGEVERVLFEKWARGPDGILIDGSTALDWDNPDEPECYAPGGQRVFLVGEWDDCPAGFALLLDEIEPAQPAAPASKVEPPSPGDAKGAKADA